MASSPQASSSIKGKGGPIRVMGVLLRASAGGGHLASAAEGGELRLIDESVWTNHYSRPPYDFLGEHLDWLFGSWPSHLFNAREGGLVINQG